EPLRIWRLRPSHGPEEGALDLAGEGAHCAGADAAIIDLSHRRDLRGGAAHERLVRAVEVIAAEAAFLDGDPLVLGDAEDGLARDPLENPAGHRRSVQD